MHFPNGRASRAGPLLHSALSGVAPTVEEQRTSLPVIVADQLRRCFSRALHLVRSFHVRSFQR